jgi:hypothetical protein
LSHYVFARRLSKFSFACVASQIFCERISCISQNPPDGNTRGNEGAQRFFSALPEALYERFQFDAPPAYCIGDSIASSFFKFE